MPRGDSGHFFLMLKVRNTTVGTTNTEGSYWTGQYTIEVK